ncbi:MAG: TonB family protein [Synergistaceae bacterium]|jgi:protein TonB|nr:TonB family protein [Synergistaceae bacterium]
MRRVIVSAAMSLAIHAMILLPFTPPDTSVSARQESRAILVSLRAVHKTSPSPATVENALPKQPEKPIPAKREQLKPPTRPAPVKEPPSRLIQKIEKLVQKKEEPARSPEIEETLVEPEDAGEAEEAEQAAAMSLAGSEQNDIPSGTNPLAGGGSRSNMERGQTVVDVTNLTVTEKVQPVYPMISRKRGEQGTVTLLVTIASGTVESVRVEKSSGHVPLDEAALKAAKGWKFQIAGTDAVVARIPFVFTLK